MTGAIFQPGGMSFSPDTASVIEVLNKGVLDQALTMAQVRSFKLFLPLAKCMSSGVRHHVALSNTCLGPAHMQLGGLAHLP